MWIPHLKISLKTFFDNIKGKGKSKGNSTVNSQYTLQNTAIELIRLKCGLSNSCSNPEWFLSCECVLNHNLIRYHISTLQMAVLLLLIIPGFTSSHWKDNKLYCLSRTLWTGISRHLHSCLNCISFFANQKCILELYFFILRFLSMTLLNKMGMLKSLLLAIFPGHPPTVATRWNRLPHPGDPINSLENGWINEKLLDVSVRQVCEVLFSMQFPKRIKWKLWVGVSWVKSNHLCFHIRY